MNSEPRQYDLDENEGVRVTNLSPSERTARLIETAREHNAIWTLADGDSLAILEHEGEEGEFLPVWPHPDYAFNWAAESLNETSVENIELAAIPVEMFAKDVAPDLAKADVKILVFPTENDGGELLGAGEFAARLA